MKKGYKRLLLFLASLIFILLINTFFINILTGYNMIFFVLVLIVVFDIYFVLEKDRHRYFKEMLFEVLTYAIFFFIFYYLLGLIVGLARTGNYYSLNGLKNFIIPIIAYTVLREILKYNLLCKADGNKLCTVLVVVFIILLDICDDYYFASFKTQYDILRFVALTLLPILARNISYSYITKKTGYKPVIIFDLIFTLFVYLLPVIPNPSEYVVSVIYLLIPVLFVYKIVNFYEKKKDRLLPSDYHKKKFVGAIVPTLIVIILVYFYSGYFRYYAIAIASGSMTPNINKGDIVIVNQRKSHNSIVAGDVLAYRKNGIIVVHRVANRIGVGDSYLYYTKGDANENVDDFVIEEDMIIGVVRSKIPVIGYPTVWFNKE